MLTHTLLFPSSQMGSFFAAKLFFQLFSCVVVSPHPLQQSHVRDTRAFVRTTCSCWRLYIFLKAPLQLQPKNCLKMLKLLRLNTN